MSTISLATFLKKPTFSPHFIRFGSRICPKCGAKGQLMLQVNLEENKIYAVYFNHRYRDFRAGKDRSELCNVTEIALNDCVVCPRLLTERGRRKYNG